MTVLSVVIVSWNTRDLLLQCLKSVVENGLARDYEIWVVDNASSDGSALAVREAFPQVKLIENTENAGFAQANNQAIERCDSQYILLLNSDTIARPGALNRLVTFMDSHPQAGASGSMLLNADGSLQESCYPFPTLGREFWRLFHLDSAYPLAVYPMQQWREDQERPVDTIQGACLLLRRAAIEQVGMLDPGYFMYTEEVDLCYRMKKAGWENHWVPQAKVVHFGGQSTRQIAPQMFLSLYRTKIRFFRKQYGAVSAFLYKLILLLAALTRLLASPFAFLQKKGARDRSLYLTRRYVDLIAALPTIEG